MSGPTHDPADYRERDVVAITRALVSVSDKTGLLELAAALAAAGVEMVSTGSTAATIAAAGHAVTEVSEITGFPESLDGRVKTLHPSVHAGILADLRLGHHEAQLEALGIASFDLVVVNLYPFVETVAAGITGDAAVEQIDIGGPAMVRASAKNHANVAIVVSPDSYPEIIAAAKSGGTTLAERRDLAARAFAQTAAYDTAVAAFFAETLASKPQGSTAQAAPTETVADFPETVFGVFQLGQVLRYGENAHQSAALYTSSHPGVAQAEQLHGKEMSYNNFVDADGAVRAAYDFIEPAVAIIKHAQPCGIAVARGSGDAIATAHIRAHECDPVSAFGGVIAANRTVTVAMAEQVRDIFTEVVVAPDFEPAALAILRAKKNIRLLKLPADYRRDEREFRQVSGGLLLQQPDVFDNFSSASWVLVSGQPADAAILADLEFAWRAVRAVKSNAILLARGGASVGVGMGQVNRVDSCLLAVNRAGSRAAGSVAASDAFFPFADGLEILLNAGIIAVAQPGGSVRDEEVIEAATKVGVTMYFTGERHFYH
ncbi:MAG: bifunctional phosphoribosylaminoimidazolecarboxamide formyltransferase/IMP cyclohydrolase [Microbacteriaceae bacterium]|nr:bifunctional phosphoribosylaminoimidazolecarboxamide formyltransferase/IMP cyclohydrolase [Microbacteriaceae bacterium]